MSTGQHSSSGLEASQHAKGATRQNVEAIAGSDPNGVRPGKPKGEPLTTHGHKPGALASEADAAPEFTAKTLPAGTAPAASTFKPNPLGENTSLPPTSDNAPSASDTIPGATSADVHTGLGHPGQGQTSAELRDQSKKGGAGLEGVGARVEGKMDEVGRPEQRALEREDAQVGVGASKAGKSTGVGGLSAEERVPEGAETVAAERK